jgi:hypothetical protein
MRKTLLMAISGAALILPFASAPATAGGFVDDFVKSIPVVGPVAGQVTGPIDSWLAELKERGSSDDVVNHLTSLNAWKNPFKPAQVADPGSITEYECTSGCFCSPRTRNPVLVKRGTSLKFVNECGGTSSGSVATPDNLSADDWHLSVKVMNDGRLLVFSNTTVWARGGADSQHAPLPKVYKAPQGFQEPAGPAPCSARPLRPGEESPFGQLPPCQGR